MNNASFPAPTVIFNCDFSCFKGLCNKTKIALACEQQTCKAHCLLIQALSNSYTCKLHNIQVRTPAKDLDDAKPFFEEWLVGRAKNPQTAVLSAPHTILGAPSGMVPLSNNNADLSTQTLTSFFEKLSLQQSQQQSAAQEQLQHLLLMQQKQQADQASLFHTFLNSAQAYVVVPPQAASSSSSDSSSSSEEDNDTTIKQSTNKSIPLDKPWSLKRAEKLKKTIKKWNSSPTQTALLQEIKVYIRLLKSRPQGKGGATLIHDQKLRCARLLYTRMGHTAPWAIMEQQTLSEFVPIPKGFTPYAYAKKTETAYKDNQSRPFTSQHTPYQQPATTTYNKPAQTKPAQANNAANNPQGLPRPCHCGL